MSFLYKSYGSITNRQSKNPQPDSLYVIINWFFAWVKNDAAKT